MAVERPPIDEPVAASAAIGRLAFSSNGSMLAAARGFAVDLREGSTGRPIRVLTGHAREVRDVAFSPEGERLATVALDDTVKI